MNLQWSGPILATVTFVAIGFGHVLVRRLHARFGTRPAVPLFATGLLVLIASLLAPINLISGVLGITAVTLIWDGVEIYRQENRLQREKG
jgi:hypothetical protein